MNILDINKLNFIKYDFIIIGAGPTGLVILEKLLKMNKKILLVDNKKNLNIFEEKTDPKKLNSNRFQNYYFGGNALAWEFQNGLFQESDFSSPFLKLFDREKLRVSINNIGKKLDIKLKEDNKYKVKPNVNFSQKNLKIENVKTIIAKEKSWVELFKDTLVNKNLDFLHATLTSIKCVNEKVVKIELNNCRKIEISEYSNIILCCGTLENGKIINNILTDKKPFNTDKNIFTNGIADHPMFETIEFYNTGSSELIKPVFHKKLFTHEKLKRKFLVRNNEKVSGLFEIRMNFENVDKRIFLKYFIKIVNKLSLLAIKNYIFKPKVLSIWFQIVQDSENNSNSYSSISNNLKCKLNENDLSNYYFMEEAILSFMKVNGFILKSRINISNLSELNEISMPAYHLSGSTKYLAQENLSTVSEKFNVRGISNLYVQGASLFPESFWVNPTFMIMAIADYFVDNVLIPGKP